MAKPTKSIFGFDAEYPPSSRNAQYIELSSSRLNSIAISPVRAYGRSISTVLSHMGACNQEEEFQCFNCYSSLVDTR